MKNKVVSPFETMLFINMQSLARLHPFALHDINMFRQSEIDADKLMRSDESELMNEVRVEIVKAKLLIRKKFPIRYRIQMIKALFIGAWNGLKWQK